MSTSLQTRLAPARVGHARMCRPTSVPRLGSLRLGLARQVVAFTSTPGFARSGGVRGVREWRQQSAVDSAAAAEAGDDVKGEIVQPSLANNPVVRSFALAAVILGAARSSAMMSPKWATFAHVVAFGAWFGASLWVSLIGGITMFKNMPRQMFGRVQAKLFPKYFLLASIMTGVMLLTPIASTRPDALLIALAASLVNWLVVEPRATRVLFERYELENAKPRDEAKIKMLYKEFSKYHGASSIFNMAALLAGFVHAWTLAAAVVV